MDTNGVIPKRLDACTFPIWEACLYGKSNKLPRNNKTAISINEYKPVASVGDCVSIDVLVSDTIGLISKRSKCLTHQRCQYEWVFVYHNYDLEYIHLLKYKNGDESVEAKESFEAYTEYHGVEIKHYHYVKRMLRSSQWMKHCKYMYQVLNFSIFIAHHQNGRAERRIRSLHDLARCHMIHSHHR